MGLIYATIERAAPGATGPGRPRASRGAAGSDRRWGWASVGPAGASRASFGLGTSMGEMEFFVLGETAV